MFDYPLLEVLQTIEREENFEHAAKTSGVTKSYISQRLRLLEERMGGITVCRDTIKTTHLGSRLCRHLENVRFLEHNFLHQHAELFNVPEQEPSTFKVAVANESLSSWFKSVLSTLHSEQNSFFLDIIDTGHDDATNDMMQGRVHAGISTNPNPVQAFTSHYLGTHAYRATATPQFVKEHFPNGVNLKALNAAPSIQYSRSENLRQTWAKQLFEAELSNCTTILPSAHGILNNCLNGGSWAVNSSLLVDKHIAAGDLVELVPGQVIASNLYWHVSRFISSTLSVLTDSVRVAALENLEQVSEDQRENGEQGT